jgi:hypothetical protein
MGRLISIFPAGNITSPPLAGKSSKPAVVKAKKHTNKKLLFNVC